ncbi:MAG TPA: hypothetical protein VGL97_24150 [Bryobacteraceae bacterium]
MMTARRGSDYIIVNAGLKLSPDESASVERLLASETLKRAPRVHAVLSYLLERSAEGRPEEINEQAIGEAVFRRPCGYNPSEDNIVRVTMRHLRERLDRYYETEGAAERWVVRIPKGRYFPVIAAREISAPPLLDEPPLILSPALSSHAATHFWSSPFLLRVGLVILLVGNVVLGYELILQRTRAAYPVNQAGLVGDVFGDPGQRLSIIGADSDLQAYRQIFGHVVSLRSYLDRTYLPPPDTIQDTEESKRIWNFIGKRKDTNISSALVAADLQRALAPRQINLRHPRDCTVRDFEHDNVVLLGGPWINPWGQLFEDRLNFRVVAPDSNAAGSEIVNLRPQSNEPRLYQTHNEGAFAVSYVRLAMVPNLRDGGKVILVGANSEEALEAGGAFLVRPDAERELLERAHTKSGSSLRPFELVLETKGLESTPRRVRIVAYRPLGS